MNFRAQPLGLGPLRPSAPAHTLPTVAGRITRTWPPSGAGGIADRRRTSPAPQQRHHEGPLPLSTREDAHFPSPPSAASVLLGGLRQGGDVIDFLQKIEHLSFVEAVERLADKVGIQLRYSDDGGQRAEPGVRMRLVEALKLAAEYYAEMLASPEAQPARQFLDERGFDRSAAETFAGGYAPRDGRPVRTARPRLAEREWRCGWPASRLRTSRTGAVAEPHSAGRCWLRRPSCSTRPDAGKY